MPISGRAGAAPVLEHKELTRRLGPLHWWVMRPSRHPVLGLLQDQKKGTGCPSFFFYFDILVGKSPSTSLPISFCQGNRASSTTRITTNTAASTSAPIQ